MDMRQKIEAAIEAVVEAAPEDEYLVAERVLAVQTSDVLFTLATAALVDAARRRRRGVVLTVEREAVGRPRRSSSAERAAVTERNEWDRWAPMAPVLSRIIEDYAADLRVQWTADLLASEFALGDGTRITWGEATIEQHRERVAMFTANVRVNIEGAARHEKAIAELETSGARSLGDLLVSVS